MNSVSNPLSLPACENDNIDFDEPEEEDELQAVAKHFGKDLGELTLEALVKLEQKRPEQEEENLEQEEHVPRRKGPSLASILGTMPSAATLGLSESISNCIGDKEENGEYLFPLVLSYWMPHF